MSAIIVIAFRAYIRINCSPTVTSLLRQLNTKRISNSGT